jgi:hypothetical protein
MAVHQAMGAFDYRCRLTIQNPDGLVISAELEGSGPPDLATVDRVARLLLESGRVGSLLSCQVTSGLAELMELAGLDLAAFGVELQGEPELGEEPLRFQHGQEERHRRNAAP